MAGRIARLIRKPPLSQQNKGCAYYTTSLAANFGPHYHNQWQSSNMGTFTSLIASRNRFAAPNQISLSYRQFSTALSNEGDETSTHGPSGDLFDAEVGPGMLGKYASIQRTFGPSSNSEAMLVAGGPVLARHASFDPTYSRAKNWIHTHPVGPALISPVLINGIIGALVEAAVPHGVPISSSMTLIRPLIVGCPTEAKITVESIEATPYEVEGDKDENFDVAPNRTDGYKITLATLVSRVRDDAKIAEGKHQIWVADYLSM